jgi:hypothetical protein
LARRSTIAFTLHDLRRAFITIAGSLEHAALRSGGADVFEGVAAGQIRGTSPLASRSRSTPM